MGEVKNSELNKIDIDDVKCELIISAFQLVSDLIMKFVIEHKEEIREMMNTIKVPNIQIKKGSDNERL